MHVLGNAVSDWVYLRNRARWAGDGYASVEIEAWDPAVGLVAYATQMMIFTFFGDPPEGHHRLPLDRRP